MVYVLAEATQTSRVSRGVVGGSRISRIAEWRAGASKPERRVTQERYAQFGLAADAGSSSKVSGHG